jgi:hypothetical protein
MKQISRINSNGIRAEDNVCPVPTAKHQAMKSERGYESAYIYLLSSASLSPKEIP